MLCPWPYEIREIQGTAEGDYNRTINFCYVTLAGITGQCS
jgi:hypothetical protein